MAESLHEYWKRNTPARVTLALDVDGVVVTDATVTFTLHHGETLIHTQELSYDAQSESYTGVIPGIADIKAGQPYRRRVLAMVGENIIFDAEDVKAGKVKWM